MTTGVQTRKAGKGARRTGNRFTKFAGGDDSSQLLAAAREVFQEVDDALGQNLSAIMRDGPDDALTLTENAQPAIMANAIAVLRVLEKEGGISLAAKADFVAGHSLGEYTALCAAGAFSLADTARLLKLRGQAMQAAVPVGVGAMCALLGADIDKAQALADAAAEGEVCTVANDNDPGQVVLSGHKGAIERAIGLVKDHGIKRGVLLPVSAPFHCPLMQPAADAMAELGLIPKDAAKTIRDKGRAATFDVARIDAIEADPAWNGGNYTAQPEQGLRTARYLGMIAGANPVALQTQYFTRQRSEDYLSSAYAASVAAGGDANDQIYQLDASRNYNPQLLLSKITVPVLWINSADDFINPPELGLAQKLVGRMPRAKFILIPASAETKGHGTHTWAKFWKADLIKLLATKP